MQPGQIVAISTEPGKLELTRAVADHAYRAGAKFVDVLQFDLHVKRSRILHAAEDTLDYVPPWYGERVLALGEHRAARIALTGPSMPGLLSDLDPARAGRDQLPFLRESAQVVNARTTNWTAVPCPTQPWAQLVHPELEPDAALARLWTDVLHMCRLDEDDPVAAWTERQDTLVGVAERLTGHGFDALHFEGPGTDLRVGLLPSSRWISARFETIDGIVPHAQPAVGGDLHDARPAARRRVRALDEAARRRRNDHPRAARALRGRPRGLDRGRRGRRAARPVRAARRGRVPARRGRARRREGRIGPLETVFYDTLIDENAASHVALGSAYEFTVVRAGLRRASTARRSTSTS